MSTLHWHGPCANHNICFLQRRGAQRTDADQCRLGQRTDAGDLLQTNGLHVQCPGAPGRAQPPTFRQRRRMLETERRQTRQVLRHKGSAGRDLSRIIMPGHTEILIADKRWRKGGSALWKVLKSSCSMARTRSRTSLRQQISTLESRERARNHRRTAWASARWGCLWGWRASAQTSHCGRGVSPRELYR